MQRLKFAVGLVSLTIVAMLGGLVLAGTALPLVAGWERVVLTSGSMQPLIDPGDVVLTTKANHPVSPGTVVVFKNPNKPGSLTTHRVIETLPDGSYRTKGDANPQPDVSPVIEEDVIGRGALLVPVIGLPAVWIQQGHPALAAAAAAMVFLLVWLGRFGLLNRYDPWHKPPAAELQDRPGLQRKPRPVITAAAAAVALAAFAAAGSWLAPQPALGAYSAATGNKSNLLTTAAATAYHLKTNSSGNTASSAILPLSSTAPTLTTLYNYDTNRDTTPGLILAKGDGLSGTDTTKIQRWMMPHDSPVALSGNVRVTLWSAIKDFNSTKKGSVIVGLYDCNNDGAACTSLASTTVTSTGSWSGGSNTWVAKEFNLGTITKQTTRMELRVAVTGSSDDAMMFAYDTTIYPSRITPGS